MNLLFTYGVESYQYSTVWNFLYSVLIQLTALFLTVNTKTFFDLKANQAFMLPLICILLVSKRRTLWTIFNPSHSSWLLMWPIINLNLHYFHKEDTAPEIYKNKLFEICDQYRGIPHFYTDGSRIDDRVGSAVVYNNTVETMHLPDGLSIFRAEMYAIMRAITCIYHIKGKHFIIFSNFMLSLEAVNGFKLKLFLVQKIIKDYTHLTNSGKTMIICWIPSHVWCATMWDLRATTNSKTHFSEISQPSRYPWKVLHSELC